MELYRTTDPMVFALWACAAFALLCWILSIATREYSWVDRLWSIAPVVYAVHFAAGANFADVRLNLMAALAAAWGTRLTYNYARKGGYRPGGEDYRWKEVKSRIGPRWFQLLNATFIAPYQNLLLLLIAAPAYVAYRAGGEPLNALDWAAAVAFVAFLAGETVADEQQWRFHAAKHAAMAKGEDPEAQFLTTGLFHWSRHPNFFCEQGVWWSFYLFSVAAAGFNWTIIGAASLTALFQGSTRLTERISRRKYPAYRDYQRRTNMLFPWPPKR